MNDEFGTVQLEHISKWTSQANISNEHLKWAFPSEQFEHFSLKCQPKLPRVSYTEVTPKLHRLLVRLSDQIPRLNGVCFICELFRNSKTYRQVRMAALGSHLPPPLPSLPSLLPSTLQSLYYPAISTLSNKFYSYLSLTITYDRLPSPTIFYHTSSTIKSREMFCFALITCNWICKSVVLWCRFLHCGTLMFNMIRSCEGDFQTAL